MPTKRRIKAKANNFFMGIPPKKLNRRIMIVDIVGTWLIGVPLGLLTSFVLGLPIYIVYFILSLEEYVRMLMEIYLFKSEKWMKNISNE